VTQVPPECTRAIDRADRSLVVRADRSLVVATKVAGELAEHTQVMDELIAHMAGLDNGMTPHKAFTQGMTSINNGRYDRRAFAETKADYAAVKRACQATTRSGASSATG
jgi:hypothetical protein